jgi:hypothetical protein
MTQAATWLLLLPTSSPVLQRLGPPWLTAEGSRIPLPYPTQARQPDTCIWRLSWEAPVESRVPPMLDQPPWKSQKPLPNQLTTIHNPCKGKECKCLINILLALLPPLPHVFPMMSLPPSPAPFNDTATGTELDWSDDFSHAL